MEITGISNTVLSVINHLINHVGPKIPPKICCDNPFKNLKMTKTTNSQARHLPDFPGYTCASCGTKCSTLGPGRASFSTFSFKHSLDKMDKILRSC